MGRPLMSSEVQTVILIIFGAIGGALIPVVVAPLFSKARRKVERSESPVQNEPRLRAPHLVVDMPQHEKPPSYVNYAGGFVDVTECKDCGRRGHRRHQPTYNPCERCGGDVDDVGAGIWVVDKWMLRNEQV